jgi:hypothetical protein
MATMKRTQVVLARVQTELGGNAYSHEDVTVVKTATMKNGSLLVGGVEAAAAAAATVDMILDCPEIDQYEVGDTIVTRGVVRSAIVDGSVMQFSDAAYNDEALPLLSGLKVQ